MLNEPNRSDLVKFKRKLDIDVSKEDLQLVKACPEVLMSIEEADSWSSAAVLAMRIEADQIAYQRGVKSGSEQGANLFRIKFINDFFGFGWSTVRYLCDMLRSAGLSLKWAFEFNTPTNHPIMLELKPKYPLPPLSNTVYVSESTNPMHLRAYVGLFKATHSRTIDSERMSGKRVVPTCHDDPSVDQTRYVKVIDDSQRSTERHNYTYGIITHGTSCEEAKTLVIWEHIFTHQFIKKIRYPVNLNLSHLEYTPLTFIVELQRILFEKNKATFVVDRIGEFQPQFFSTHSDVFADE